MPGPSQNTGLANLKPWQPGQSGNPGGRPKTRHFREAIDRVRQLTPAELKTYKPKDVTELLVVAQIATGATGGPQSVTAFNALADRLDGKAAMAEEDREALRSTEDKRAAFAELLELLK